MNGCLVIAFEELTDVRERTGASWGHKWAFTRLYKYVKYKAEKRGIEVTEGSRVFLGFGDHREVTYAVLTPSEAQTVATVLEAAAQHADAVDTIEDPTDE